MTLRHFKKNKILLAGDTEHVKGELINMNDTSVGQIKKKSESLIGFEPMTF